MENRFWGEEVRVTAQLESAELGDLGEKVGVEPGEGGCLNQNQGSQHRYRHKGMMSLLMK